MRKREPLSPATQPPIATPLTAKRVAFQIGAVTIAIGVTTWLACSAETPSPSPNATAPKTPPTAPKTPTGDLNAASSQRAVDTPTPVAPATKFMVLPDTKKTAPKTAPKRDTAKNNASDNKRPAFDVMPATKSGRIDRETLERMYKRDKDNEAKPSPPPPVFPATKAAVLPNLNRKPIPAQVQPEANAAPTQATKRRRSRRRRNTNAPNPEPQQQAAPPAQSAD